MRVHKSAIFLSLLLVSLVAGAQSISSVYSNNGIGMLNYSGLPHNMGMGEVGIGVPSIWNLNYQNPAFLPFNSLTVFQVGIEMDRRNIVGNNLTGKKVSTGLRYLNFAFPVAKGWTSSFGITPYSTVNNRTFTITTIEEISATANTSYQGSGGLSTIHWSNGFRLGKNLYLGARSAYIFGSIQDNERSEIVGSQTAYQVALTDRLSYSGLKWELAIGYVKKLNDKRTLNFGLVQGLSKNLKGSHDQLFETRTADGILLLSRDVFENEATSFTLPSSTGVGISYQVDNKYLVGLDVTSTAWSKGGNEDDEFVSTLKVGLGAQWTPDAGSISSYWKRTTYRVGFNFENLPYQVNDQKLREFGINIGGSFPVGFSNLDLAMKFGRLGTQDQNLIRETYFRIVIGATINDRWFVKRKYD